MLLALLEELIATAVTDWRDDIEAPADPLDGLPLLLSRLHQRSSDPAEARLSRALSVYHLQLVHLAIPKR